MVSPSRWWRAFHSADAVRGPFDACRKAMTSIGFVGNRGALGGLGTALLPMPQIASGKPVRRGHFRLTAADLSGRPVRLADRAVHQLGGQHRELTSLRPSLRPQLLVGSMRGDALAADEDPLGLLDNGPGVQR
jgi:hypothetical protein